MKKKLILIPALIMALMSCSSTDNHDTPNSGVSAAEFQESLCKQWEYPMAVPYNQLKLNSQENSFVLQTKEKISSTEVTTYSGKFTIDYKNSRVQLEGAGMLDVAWIKDGRASFIFTDINGKALKFSAREMVQTPKP